MQVVRERACGLGVRLNHGGERPLTRRSTGRQKRTAFGSLRWRSGAGYLSVTPHEYNRVRRLLFNSGISDLFADRTGAFFAAKAIVWGQTDLSNG